MPPPEVDLEGLEARIHALPGLDAVCDVARRSGARAYLVGGAVRDALLGGTRADLDIVVEGDASALVKALGGEARTHDRFGTATVRTGAGEIDVATARSETYARPGALPDVQPAGIDDDLGRRDFTINALAVPLFDDVSVLDPHGGVGDLRAGVIRVLHDGSFVDDPTRALRAVRYAARLAFEVEPRTLALLEAADLASVSAERVEAELRKLAQEADPVKGFELAERWGLIEPVPGAGELVAAALSVVASATWRDEVPKADAVLAARNGLSDEARALAALDPQTPSEGVEAARGKHPLDLVLARALGAAWLDRYLAEWRHVRLDISGSDLLEAGVQEGPAVGRGLGAALRAKLDGEVSGADAELRLALDAARAS